MNTEHHSTCTYNGFVGDRGSILVSLDAPCSAVVIGNTMRVHLSVSNYSAQDVDGVSVYFGNGNGNHPFPLRVLAGLSGGDQFDVSVPVGCPVQMDHENGGCDTRLHVRLHVASSMRWDVRLRYIVMLLLLVLLFVAKFRVLLSDSQLLSTEFYQLSRSIATTRTKRSRNYHHHHTCLISAPTKTPYQLV
jgi:hypothetical protein